MVGARCEPSFPTGIFTSDSKINVTTDVGAMSEGISRHCSTAVDYRRQ
jgi:hypothetical protein